MTVWRQFHDRVFDHRVLISLLALSGGLELWLLPEAATRHGGGAFLLMWMFLVFAIGIPVIIFEIAIGSSLQCTISEGIRKASRRAEWLGWIPHVLALVMGVMVVVLGAWCLGLAFDAVLSLFGNTPPAWEMPDATSLVREVSPTALRDGILATVTGREVVSADSLLLRIGRAVPVGRVMVALGVIWFGVLWVVVKGISGFRLLARILLPIILALVLLNLLVQLGRFGAVQGVARIFAPRWGALLSLSAWCEAACLALLTVPLGLGVQASLAGVSMRQFDYPAASLVSLAITLMFHLLVLMTIAASQGAWALGMQIRLVELDLSGIQSVLVGLPASAGGSGGSLWASALILLFAILPMVLIAFALASVLVLSPILAWSRHRRIHLRKATVTLGVFLVAGSLTFATTEGFGLWQGLMDSLRYLVVPVAVATLLRTGVKTVGVGGLADYITAYSAIHIGPGWRISVRWLLPLALLVLALIQSVTYCVVRDFEPETCLLFLMPLVLLPLVAWFAKRFASLGRR